MNSRQPNRSGGANRYSSLIVWTTVAVIVILIIVAILYFSSANREVKPPSGKSRGTVISSEPRKELPEMKNKPQPRYASFRGCPPEGDGGDPELNRNKNRIDEGDYIPVEFDAILGLSWPRDIERRDHKNWPAQARREIGKYEGIPVAVEGYLFGAKQSGPESCNCHGADKEFRDYHVWLVKTQGDDRTKSIVTEVTPSLREKHPNWELKNLNKIARQKQKVRISGWLMFDPEHPDQINKTRGTIWEIHPIMMIEVEEDGKWVNIDDLNFRKRGGNA
ncbi:MAG: hypothetical protein HF314_03945 [Ignavibacteria bacterium]|jgi:hypothetical protein|nr:hypothetical protein [Ignavibacteria bacterium]MCU7502204.1 hypothetical protein [Ignavibacteria bacterium]MCU7517421.1 hypothetical protein [Ignavibacteria bacterium]